MISIFVKILFFFWIYFLAILPIYFICKITMKIFIFSIKKLTKYYLIKIKGKKLNTKEIVIISFSLLVFLISFIIILLSIINEIKIDILDMIATYTKEDYFLLFLFSLIGLMLCNICFKLFLLEIKKIKNQIKKTK